MICYFSNKGRRAVAFLAVISILLSFVGCRKAEGSSGFLVGDSLSSLEELYGVNQTEAFKALDLSESDLSQGAGPGSWEVKQPVLLQGAEFSETILCDVSSETLYGIRYSYHEEDVTKAIELIGNLLEESVELYGEPSTYPGIPSRLTTETFQMIFRTR